MTLPMCDAIVAELTGTDAPSVFAELCAPLVVPTGLACDELVATLSEREALASTGLGSGVAIPHGVHPGLSRIFTSFGRAPMGVPFGAPDGQPVRLFVALLRPADAAGAHLKALARWGQVLGNPDVRAALLAAASAEDVARVLGATR